MQELRNVNIKVRLTEKEKNSLLEKMKLAKIPSISEFIRRLIRTGYAVNINTNGLLNLTFEINKIGVNINQIAKIANESHHIYANDIKEISEKVDYIESKLSDLIKQIDKINGR